MCPTANYIADAHSPSYFIRGFEGTNGEENAQEITAQVTIVAGVRRLRAPTGCFIHFVAYSAALHRLVNTYSLDERACAL